MRESAKLDLPVAVHAENEEITKSLTNRLVAAGKCDVAAFLESRPVIAELEAIQRAALFAGETGCKLHVVHISSGRGVATALEARARGVDISIETCPHYLFFTADDLLRIGSLAKCAPPLRCAADRDELWSAVLRGDVDIIGSDHSPCPPEMKQRDSFFEIWGGIAGIQTTLPVVINAGLEIGRIAAMTATNGARRFNIEHKGAIEIGSHADLALVDLRASWFVSRDSLLDRHRTSPYTGSKLRGVVHTTIRRGEIIYANGTVRDCSHGKLIRPMGNRNATTGTHA